LRLALARSLHGLAAFENGSEVAGVEIGQIEEMAWLQHGLSSQANA
jgi:hypothetical protein